MSDEYPAWPVAHRSQVYRNPETGALTELRYVRKNGGPVFDELVTDGAFVHIEQMDYDHWWMDVNGIHLNFHRQGKRIVVEVEPHGSADNRPVDVATVERWADQSRHEMEERFEEMRKEKEERGDWPAAE